MYKIKTLTAAQLDKIKNVKIDESSELTFGEFVTDLEKETEGFSSSDTEFLEADRLAYDILNERNLLQESPKIEKKESEKVESGKVESDKEVLEKRIATLQKMVKRSEGTDKEVLEKRIATLQKMAKRL